MTEVPSSHPRYASLVLRERLVEGFRSGIVAPQGLIAHGRGEMFDYLLGERTTKEARVATRAATALLLTARNPVLSVNGNVAALCPGEIVRLAKVTRARLEVCLFHRTDERVSRIQEVLERNGAEGVLGFLPDASLPGVDHARGMCSKEGIHSADVVLIPLEDGDRAEALSAMGKKTIAVDLNPLSRTSRSATVAIVDEVTRAVKKMLEDAEDLVDSPEAISNAVSGYNKTENIEAVMARMASNLGGI